MYQNRDWNKPEELREKGQSYWELREKERENIKKAFQDYIEKEYGEYDVYVDVFTNIVTGDD